MSHKTPDVTPRICGIGTSVPQHTISREEGRRFISSVAEHHLPPEARDRSLRLLREVFRQSHVEQRYSVIPDYGCSDPSDFKFFPENWELDPFPTTSDRMSRFKTKAIDLIETAARRALKDAGVQPAEITHLVMTSCTGHFSPGPDVQLIDRLGLRPTVKRTLIGFMGCHAGFNGMHSARRILRAEPGARVLQVSVELCSLHFQNNFSRSDMITNSLFGDGCAAVVYESDMETEGDVTIEAIQSRVDSSDQEHMTWEIGDHGFRMFLSPDIPDVIQSMIRPFCTSLADQGHLSLDRIDGWVIHPGGPSILDRIQQTLNLPDDQMDPSREVLRTFGNMSSPTIFFVLNKLLHRTPRPEKVIALGFGPGVTVEGALLST